MSWTQNKIRWAVLGRLSDELGSGGDIDIVLHPADRKTAIRLLVDLIDESGWKLTQVLQHETSAWYAVIAVPKDGSWLFLKLDLCTDYRISGRLMLRAEELLEGVETVEDAHNIAWLRPKPSINARYYLIKCLAKARIDSDTLGFINQLGCPTHEILGTRFKEDEQKRLKKWLRGEEQAQAPVIQAMYRNFAARQPKATLSEWMRIWHRLVKPSGLHLVLTGPDGIGKSTTAKILASQLEACFRGVTRAHLFNISRGNSGIKPVAPYQKPPRGFLASALKLLLVVYRTQRLFWSFIFWSRIRSILILNDRHFVDLVADPPRFRIALPQAILRWARAITPAPDLTVCLIASADTIQNRKAEVSREMTEQQIAQYHQIARSDSAVHMIKADAPSELVAQRLTTLCVETLAARQAQRDWRL